MEQYVKRYTLKEVCFSDGDFRYVPWKKIGVGYILVRGLGIPLWYGNKCFWFGCEAISFGLSAGRVIPMEYRVLQVGDLHNYGVSSFWFSAAFGSSTGCDVYFDWKNGKYRIKNLCRTWVSDWLDAVPQGQIAKEQMFGISHRRLIGGCNGKV